MNQWLRDALGLCADESPFPWQEELLRRFMEGRIDRALDIPTGLGKTAVMAIWLVARAAGAKLPRRLAYIVDRRTVVDQATELALRLRDVVDRSPDLKQALGLEQWRSLPISTLRGQHVDNREWLEDPAAPAIIVGTVDMIGSRLLFEGYGVSRKMRTYHAGLLGVDTLVVLDEAHLVPPFEQLLRTIATDDAGFGPRDRRLPQIVRPLALLALSATGRTTGTVFGLTPADFAHPIVKKRLDAKKRLRVQPLEDDASLEEQLARRAWALSDRGKKAVRCVVFSDKREVAENARRMLEKLVQGDRKGGRPLDIETELFVGGRRVFEREAGKDRLKALGFIAGSKVERARPAFLFATSAGEVGVDLDADHMVCDLVAWERMVQRLGRVNRRGDGDAEVIVLVEPAPTPTSREQEALDRRFKDEALKDETRKRIDAFEARVRTWCSRQAPLNRLLRHGDFADASPGALHSLRARAEAEPDLQALLDAATTPVPLRPALSRALVDAWAMTSLEEHTGRPEVQPWLRGWVDDEPQTSVVWRRYLPVTADGFLARKHDVEAFFEAAPPHAIEMLDTETHRVVTWLMARAEAMVARVDGSNGHDSVARVLPLRLSDVAMIALTRAGDQRTSCHLADLLEEEALEEALRRAGPDERARVAALRRRNESSRRQKAEQALKRMAAGATLLVDWRLGGLGESGLLDKDLDELPTTVDDEARSLGPMNDGGPMVRFRVRCTAGVPSEPENGWWPRFRLAIHETEDGEGTYLVVDKWREDAATEEDRSAARWPQLLEEHELWAEERARSLAAVLGLDEYAEMIAVAARLHDEGKRAKRWQRAFRAPQDGVYAKTKGPINYHLLDGYRHELGSVRQAVNDDGLRALSEEQRELALHLIAAHHGFARPVIRTSGCDDAPPSALEATAREIALRFTSLEKRWGPWGLAWWESLLRAADQEASRRNEKKPNR